MLAPEGPAYKALIVRQSDNLTLSAVKKLKAYAQSGLPVIVSGAAPGYYPSGNASQLAVFKSELLTLLRTRNVHSIGNEGIAAALRKLGLAPNVGLKANGTWYTTFRQDTSYSVDYIYVIGDLNATSGSITVKTSKMPYVFDAWTAEIKPLLQYKKTAGSITIPLSLAGNQTKIIALSNGNLAGTHIPNVHALQVPSNVIDYSISKDGGWSLKIAHSDCRNAQKSGVLLSTRKQVSTESASSVASALDLTSWTLTAEHWAAPEDIFDAATIARKFNTTHHLNGPLLPSWADIPALANVSGLGYYSTSFTWPPQCTSRKCTKAQGAFLSLPPVLQAVRIFINGHQTVPLDNTKPIVDIGPYLRTGQNKVLAIVPTTMWNYLRSIMPEIVDQGTIPLLEYESQLLGEPLPAMTDNGLIGVVQVVPYATLAIRS